MKKYIQIHISGNDKDVELPTDKRKINYHYFIKRDGSLIFLKDITKKNKHQNNEGIDIILSGKDQFTCDTIFTLKHLIYKLRIAGNLPLLWNSDNLSYIQNVFQIF